MKDAGGCTALFYVCSCGYAGIARILLDHGAIVDYQSLVSTMIPCCSYTKNCLITQEGASPIYIASQEGHLQVIQVLLEYDASVNLVNDVSHYSMVFIPFMCRRFDNLG